LRKYFVEHEGKAELPIFMSESPKITNKYEEMIIKFNEQLKSNVKNEGAKILENNFGTSTEFEKIAGNIIAMCTFKKYFKYVVKLAKQKKIEKDKEKYGIRNLIFMGTLDDWNLLQEKCEKLIKFEAENWIKRLSIIISKFIETYKLTDLSIIDHKFWDSGIKIEGKGPNAKMSGWATAFFPYKKSGDLVSGNEILLREIPDQISNCSFAIDLGDKVENYKIKCGYTGILYENETFRPQLTFAIIKNEEKKAKKCSETKGKIKAKRKRF